ncbi:insulinase family protein [Brachybacterium halotolerans subsp. kimchii]|uniref:M16 family metallopeptidase n=1 Tax=Brachybacterium halotolerans TaxID=2795215 RepID=UPI001E4D1DBF|nr:pitrilysin family protein [Brachybacterium halotolerans]UEJ83701.1 insulinase family protein [Brachybacterium halotolerans subsp. kimchii]
MPIDLTTDAAERDQLLEPGGDGPLVRRTILPGGVRLLTETDRSVRSATLGLWLPVGSRDETPAHAGSTHALEHLLFKGTARRSALDIATAFDEVGGESNAVTAKEHTVYHGRVRSADLPLALDVLTDMVTSSQLAPEALETEREVILEELAMARDDPTDSGYEEFLAQVLGPDTPMGRPVGGTLETVSALTDADVRAHFAAHYRPQNLVVTAVGDLDHDELAGRLADRLAAGGWDLPEGVAPSERRPALERSLPAAGATPGPASAVVPHHIVRPLEQTHIYLGGPSICATSEDRHTMNVLMAILGGGMSSRLFQHIREERGLVYTVYSFSAAYRDAGLFGMYAACRPSRAEQVVELMGAEIEQMRDHGVTDEEMRRALGQITGALALGLEDTASRMGRLGSLELVQGRYSTVDEALEKMAGVTAQDVRDLAARLAESFTTRVDVGPEAG